MRALILTIIAGCNSTSGGLGGDADSDSDSDSDTSSGTATESDTESDTAELGVCCGPTPSVDPFAPDCSVRCMEPEVCCESWDGYGSYEACAPEPQCPIPYPNHFACDGPEDCAPGLDCCEVVTDDYYGTFATQCLDACPVPYGRLCHSERDCDGADETCCVTNNPMFYSFCTTDSSPAQCL